MPRRGSSTTGSTSRRIAPAVRAAAAAVERLAADQHAPSRSIHLQTDDVDAVVRAVQQFVPRLPGGSQGSVVMPPLNGWTAVYDELCDREPAMPRRLALELSDRMGAVICAIGIEEGAVVRYVLLERGRVMDEYASVPEYQGPLPPGDVVALSANPTVLAPDLGADPALVRETAKTAERPSDLPPPVELLAALAEVIGLPLARALRAGAPSSPAPPFSTAQAARSAARSGRARRAPGREFHLARQGSVRDKRPSATSRRSR